VYNRSATSAALLSKKEANGKNNLHAASTGFKFEGIDYKFGGIGYINFDFSMTESYIET
jgi:hypothetical protein